METTDDWDLVIKPKSKLLSLKSKEIWLYRDLLFLLVRRDITSTYKQNILGPAWYLIQAIFSIVTYYFMFGRIGGIPTDNKPSLLFYLSGLLLWNYFIECLNSTSNVFVANASLFSKVYFPRLIVPISIIVSSLFKFLIQMLLFIFLWTYYYFTRPSAGLTIGVDILIFPLLILIVAVMGMSFGILISALTTKYRDLRNLMSYVLQFALYATPIIYSLSWIKVKIPLFYKICLINPMTSLIETFKYILIRSGSLNWNLLLYAVIFTSILFIISLSAFNKVEKTFVDSV